MTNEQRRMAVKQVDTWANWLVERGRQLQDARITMTYPTSWRSQPANRARFTDAARMLEGIDDYQINESLKVLERVLQRLVATH